MPKLDEIVAGIQNDPKHIMSFLRLTRTLLYLVLEFPGLPSGVAGRTALGQSLKEIGVHRENFSELMKMFLLSRCEKAQKVKYLISRIFCVKFLWLLVSALLS